MALNQHKPYGEIHGEAGDARYAQDGIFFREDGTVIEDHPLYSAATKAKAAQHAARDGIVEDDHEEPAKDEIDLRDWALGDIDVPFITVRRTMKAKFGVSPRSQEDAFTLLVEHGVVTKDELKG